jgi:hypothetical protein
MTRIPEGACAANIAWISYLKRLYVVALVI